MKKIFLLVITSFIGLAVVGQVGQTVTVEHYTNTRCGNCASKNPAFFSLLDEYPDVIHIAYHPSAPYPECIFSLHNPVENDARTDYYGIYGATPRVVVQGEVIPPGTPLLSAAQLESKLGMTSDYSISIKQDQVEATDVLVQIVIKKVSGTANDNLNLYALIAEETINYAAPNGEDVHHDVFRKVLADEEITLQSVGDSAVITKNYGLHPDWQPNQMFIAGMLQDNETKTIMQSGKSGLLGAPSSVGENDILAGRILVYPNPVNDILKFDPVVRKKFTEAILYTMQGQAVKTVDMTGDMDVSNLPGGQYVLMMKDESGATEVVKVQKR